jgi:hypothetical protein
MYTKTFLKNFIDFIMKYICKKTNRTVLKKNLKNLQIFLTISSDSDEKTDSNPVPVQLFWI